MSATTAPANGAALLDQPKPKQRLFESLKVRNFKLFFWGQLVSVTGTWLQATAQSWLVLKELHGGAGALGLLTGVQFLPTLLFGLWAGVIADRFDRRKILLCTNAWQTCTASVLGILVLTGTVRLWMVFAIAFASGLANAVEMPTRQAFLGEVVGPARLPNAVALSSATFNSGRIFGPALAALMILAVGTGWCFILNAVSFLAVIAGVFSMRLAEMHPIKRAARASGQIRDGLRYAWASPPLRSTLILVAVVGLLSLNFMVTLPLLAKDVFHGDAGTVGLFSTMQGAGALVGALTAARRKAPTPRLLSLSAVALGCTMLGEALAPTLPTELVAVSLNGVAFMTLMLTANSTLQLNSSQEKRGRVMALYVMMFGGTTPFGGPLIGFISDHFGARTGAGLGGVAALGGAAIVPTVYRSMARNGTAAASSEPLPVASTASVASSTEHAGATVVTAAGS